MELKEFIKATIITIAESIEDLNNELEDKAIVNPKSIDMINRTSNSDKLINVLEYGDYNNIRNARLIQDIEFNLTISKAETDKQSGGIRIEVFKAGISSKKEIENTNTVKFSIPVAFLK